LLNSSIKYWKPIVEDWKDIEGEIVQLTGPWRCPNCNGHVMLDYAYYELGGCSRAIKDPSVKLQYEGQEYCFCPYCKIKLRYPKEWPGEENADKSSRLFE
jgi:hypothetical protein